MSDDSRYDEILRRIEQKKREQANAPKQDDLAAILDGVNAWGFLEDIKKAKLEQITCYGPKSFRGHTSAPWVGVVLWYKPRGYFHYETLTLLGLWAYEDSGERFLTLGMKALKFTAPIFNAESYYHHIKRRFDLYYPGDASPPSDGIQLYSVQYDPSKRLEIRAAIQQELTRWLEAYR
jgi:hypothetical protein